MTTPPLPVPDPENGSGTGPVEGIHAADAQQAIRRYQHERYQQMFEAPGSLADRLAETLAHPEPDLLATRPPVAAKARHRGEAPPVLARDKFAAHSKGGARKKAGPTRGPGFSRRHFVGVALAVSAVTGGVTVSQSPMLAAPATQTIQVGPTSAYDASPVAAALTTREPSEDPAQALLDLAAIDLADLNPRQLAAHAQELQAAFAVAVVAYETATEEAAEASGEAAAAERNAERAEAKRDKAANDLADTLASNYVRGPESDALLVALMSGPASLGDFATDVQTIETFTERQILTLDDLDRLAAVADLTRDRAHQLRRQADAAESHAEDILDAVQTAAATASATATKATLGRSNEFGVIVSPEQRRANQKALREWRRYLTRLGKAEVVPPLAADLLTGVPFGMSALPSAAGSGSVLGVAQVRYRGRSLPVLSQETIAAVSAAFTRLGQPYLAPVDPAEPDGTDPAATGPGFSCAGLIADAWNTSGMGLPQDIVAQYTGTKPVDPANLQVGDLVFFDDPAAPGTVQHVGINLGAGQMLASDASVHQVGVFPFPGSPFIATRPSLPRPTGPAATPDATQVPAGTPVTSPASEATTPPAPQASECGGTPAALSAMGMQMPIAEGNFNGFTGTFGEPGSLWASGYHTGLDFSADTGVPVMAAKSGTVTLAKKAWAGTLVSIDHGDGITTTYAHMSQIVVKDGQQVTIGDFIGAVGEEGNTTGPHLHFEVLVNGTAVDPMPYLLSGSGPGGWGGHSNGLIPAEALCSPTTASGHLLRCDAASAFDALSRAYQAKFGTDLCITDSYRSYALQVQTFAKKPGLAAVPGTSNHGWGLAVDLCGGIESFTSPQFAWMSKNAPRYGWVHPEWASANGSRPEPWHWEFGDLT